MAANPRRVLVRVEAADEAQLTLIVPSWNPALAFTVERGAAAEYAELRAGDRFFGWADLAAETAAELQLAPEGPAEPPLAADELGL